MAFDPHTYVQDPRTSREVCFHTGCGLAKGAAVHAGLVPPRHHFKQGRSISDCEICDNLRTHSCHIVVEESTLDGFKVIHPPEGRKDDADKDRYDLLPTGALAEVVKVLTYGAKKYAPESWRKVEGYRWRYFAAAMRHLWAWKRGQSSDPESGCHHLAHAICCLMFLMELSVLEELEGADRG